MSGEDKDGHFLWFDDLHGWWNDNPVCNVVYGAADPHVDQGAETANLFNFQTYPESGLSSAGPANASFVNIPMDSPALFQSQAFSIPPVSAVGICQSPISSSVVVVLNLHLHSSILDSS